MGTTHAVGKYPGHGASSGSDFLMLGTVAGSAPFCARMRWINHLMEPGKETNNQGHHRTRDPTLEGFPFRCCKYGFMIAMFTVYRLSGIMTKSGSGERSCPRGYVTFVSSIRISCMTGCLSVTTFCRKHRSARART